MVDIAALVRRADRYAATAGRTSGGVSKALFDDVRTLDKLRAGATSITIARLQQADDRLRDLEISERAAGAA